MKYSSYVGDGPEVAPLVNLANAAVNKYRNAANALLEGMAVGMNIYDDSCGFGWVSGFYVFGLKLSNEEISKHGISLVKTVEKGHSRWDDAMYDAMYVYKPNFRTIKGRDLIKRIKAVNTLRTSFSNVVIANLKIERLCLVNHPPEIHDSSVMHINNKLYISIPRCADDIKSKRDKFPMFPEIPTWFRAPYDDECKYFSYYGNILFMENIEEHRQIIFQNWLDYNIKYVQVLNEEIEEFQKSRGHQC
jgi:hypothetical protein